MKLVGRWLLVLPAAIAGMVVAQLLYLWTVSQCPWPDFMAEIVKVYIYGIVGPVFFVAAGAYTAPQHERGVAIGLAMLFSMVVGVGICMGLTFPGAIPTKFAWAQLLVGVIGAGYGCHFVHQNPGGKPASNRPRVPEVPEL